MTGDWLHLPALLRPDAIAIIPEGTGAPLTYGEWNVRVNRVARFLSDGLGLKQGDRIAILAKNRLEYLDLLFASGKLGLVLQTLNWRLTDTELRGILGEAPPKILFFDAAMAPVTTALKDAKVAERWGALDESQSASDIAYADYAKHDGGLLVPAIVHDDTPWVICYTGGSTGLPKGALLTHGSMMANAVNTVTTWSLTARDVAILNAPMFHVGGLSVLTLPLVLSGGTSILCDGFDAGRVLDLCDRGLVTMFFGVPTMFLALLEHPRFKTADLSKLRLVISGGAPCPPAIFDAMEARGVPFKQGYGLTEAGPNNFWLPQDQVRSKPGCVGYPMFRVEAKVVGDGGEPGARGVPGELLLRGPHVFGGYFNKPEETSKVVRDGWLHTGDVAVVDEDGAFAIVGRVKDVIISGGENIYPAEVEGVLSLHPAVAEVAIVAASDPRWGEVGVAIVVLRRDAEDDSLRSFCRERLAKYKVPKSFVRVTELPRTGAGKVDKPALRARYGG